MTRLPARTGPSSSRADFLPSFCARRKFHIPRLLRRVFLRTTCHICRRTSRTEYPAWIRRILRTKIAAVRALIPVSWEIDTPERHYSISSRPLISLLRVAESNSAVRKAKLEAARDWISDLQPTGRSIRSAARVGDDSSARAKAKDILSRREYAGIVGTKPGESPAPKINEWIRRLFIWLFGGLGEHPIATQTFFWLIVAVVVAWLAHDALSLLVAEREAGIDRENHHGRIPSALAGMDSRCARSRRARRFSRSRPLHLLGRRHAPGNDRQRSRPIRLELLANLCAFWTIPFPAPFAAPRSNANLSRRSRRASSASGTAAAPPRRMIFKIVCAKPRSSDAGCPSCIGS